MKDSQLKKLFSNIRRRLIGAADEDTAYKCFIQLIAGRCVDPNYFQMLLSTPEDERIGCFAMYNAQFSAIYGGVFNYSMSTIPELLLSDSGTVHALSLLPDEYFSGAEAIGRSHQLWLSEKRCSILSGLRENHVSPEDIPTATQIFTPMWIARFLAQNTIGKCLSNSNSVPLPAECTKYMLGKPDKCLPLEKLTVLDPCCGSGNILLAAFDLLLEAYRNAGIPDKTAAGKILRCHLFGLDIDSNACAIAETSLRIKAAEYGCYETPQIYSFDNDCQFEDAVTLGSLITPDSTQYSGKTADIATILRRKFRFVITNPPYISSACMNSGLLNFIKANYRSFAADLFSVFMVRCMEMAKNSGSLGFLAPSTWMFTQSYEALRKLIFGNSTVSTLLHFEYSAFEDAAVPLSAFTLDLGNTRNTGTYLRLEDFRGGMAEQENAVISAAVDSSQNYVFHPDQRYYALIDGSPAAYWLSEHTLSLYSLPQLRHITDIRQGLITGNNSRFLRLWHEVSSSDIAFFRSSDKKWHPINKGGSFRRWYGNRDHVVLWENDGEAIKNYRSGAGKLLSRPQNLEYNFKPAASWSLITSGGISARFYDENFMFNVAGISLFTGHDELLEMLALLNSCVAQYLTRALNPTMNMNVGDAGRLPVADFVENKAEIIALTEENIRLSKEDWDNFETSFEFEKHPLI